MKKAIGLLAILAWVCSSGAASQTRTILVFPFENRSASSDLGWISEAFAEVLSTRLAGPGRFILDRGERNTAYHQLGIPPNTTLTLASEYKVAQNLGVDWAVVGGFKVSGQELRAESQLLDVTHLKLYPAVDISGSLASLVDIQTRLAWRLLSQRSLIPPAVSEQEFAGRFPTLRLDAFENYIRGILAADSDSKVQFLTAAERLSPADHRAAFALGQYYFRRKDYKESALWLSKLSEKDQDYLASLFMSGVDDFFLGADKQAEQDFQSLSQQIPLNEVWNDLGVLEARRNDYRDAVESFRHAWAGDPTDPDYSFNVGAAYCGLKDYRSAAEYLQKALARNPNDPGVRTLLAYVLGKEGDAVGSKAQLAWVSEHEGRSMGELSPGILPQPRLKRVYDGAAFKLLSVAVQNSLETELAGKPAHERAQLYLARGEQFVKQGLFPQAIRDLTQAVSLAPDNGEAHLFLGQAYELYGQHQKAIDEFQAALAVDDSAVAHLWLAHCYLSLHQSSEALGQCRQALALDPGNTAAETLMKSIGQQSKILRKDP